MIIVPEYSSRTVIHADTICILGTFSSLLNELSWGGKAASVRLVVLTGSEFFFLVMLSACFLLTETSTSGPLLFPLDNASDDAVVFCIGGVVRGCGREELVGVGMTLFNLSD